MSRRIRHAPHTDVPPGPRAFAFTRIALALVALGVLAVPLPATAALMRYEYSGVITRSDPSTGIAAGTPFSGTFAYDDEQDPQSWIGIEGSRTYHFGTRRNQGNDLPRGPTDLSLQVGSKTVLAGSESIRIGLNFIDNPNYVKSLLLPDAEGKMVSVPSFVSVSNLRASGDSASPIVSLDIVTGDLLNGLIEPDIALIRAKLADLPDAFLHVSNWPGSTDPSSTNLDGRITSIQLIQVPEPTTVLAFGLILGAAASHRWRASRRVRFDT